MPNLFVALVLATSIIAALSKNRIVGAMIPVLVIVVCTSQLWTLMRTGRPRWHVRPPGSRVPKRHQFAYYLSGNAAGLVGAVVWLALMLHWAGLY